MKSNPAVFLANAQYGRDHALQIWNDLQHDIGVTWGSDAERSAPRFSIRAEQNRYELLATGAQSAQEIVTAALSQQREEALPSPLEYDPTAQDVEELEMEICATLEERWANARNYQTGTQDAALVARLKTLEEIAARALAQMRANELPQILPNV